MYYDIFDRKVGKYEGKITFCGRIRQKYDKKIISWATFHDVEFRNDTQLYTGNIEKYTVGLVAFVHFGGNFLSYANENRKQGMAELTFEKGDKIWLLTA